MTQRKIMYIAVIVPIILSRVPNVSWIWVTNFQLINGFANYL